MAQTCPIQLTSISWRALSTFGNAIGWGWGLGGRARAAPPRRHARTLSSFPFALDSSRSWCRSFRLHTLRSAVELSDVLLNLLPRLSDMLQRGTPESCAALLNPQSRMLTQRRCSFLRRHWTAHVYFYYGVLSSPGQGAQAGGTAQQLCLGCRASAGLCAARRAFARPQGTFCFRELLDHCSSLVLTPRDTLYNTCR